MEHDDPGADGVPARDYCERAPHRALAHWVECLWTKRAGAASARPERILPDGCADFLFDRVRGEAWLIGAMSRPFEFVPGGEVDLVAVRFRPGAAYHAVRGVLADWTDGRLALGELGAWARALAEEVGAPGASATRLARLEEELLRRFEAARADAIDHVLRGLARDPAGFRVGDAAGESGLTRQWLTRSIRARAGLGPKELARILLLRGTLSRLARGRALAAAALDGGYADQAHFTREARRITGATPSRLRTLRTV
jgi:AraC-like DNA-binding protein